MYIRLARRDDAGSIAALHVASWRDTYRDELSGEFLGGLDVGERALHWEAEIAGGADVLVAEDVREIVGFVACGATRDSVNDAGETFEIYNLHVAPARHGQGIGRLLFDEALLHARAAGSRTLSLWVVESNANARRFYERQGLRADGARQVHPLGPGAELREMRYRMQVEAAETQADGRQGAAGPAGADNWKLLEPIEQRKTESRGMPIAMGALLLVLIVVIGFWFFRGLNERAATIAAQQQLGSAPVADARRAAEREVHLLLRPVDHEGNIGADRAARSWQLGLAYGRLAIVEERAGDTAKRDEYFDRARRALREAGVPDPTDTYIRERLRSASPAPR